jgi:hypothetical protein
MNDILFLSIVERVTVNYAPATDPRVRVLSPLGLLWTPKVEITVPSRTFRGYIVPEAIYLLALDRLGREELEAQRSPVWQQGGVVNDTPAYNRMRQQLDFTGVGPYHATATMMTDLFNNEQLSKHVVTMCVTENYHDIEQCSPSDFVRISIADIVAWSMIGEVSLPVAPTT